MDAKQKANDLVDKFYPFFTSGMGLLFAKQCAVITAEELRHEADDEADAYWAQVITEINNLES